MRRSSAFRRGEGTPSAVRRAIADCRDSRRGMGALFDHVAVLSAARKGARRGSTAGIAWVRFAQDDGLICAQGALMAVWLGPGKMPAELPLGPRKEGVLRSGEFLPEPFTVLCLHSRTGDLRYRGRFLLQLFRLEVTDQRVDNGLELAIHHIGELVNCEADAVVGDAVLREVVGADLLAAVAAADHRFALFCQGFLLLLHFDFVQARAQDAHALFA